MFVKNAIYIITSVLLVFSLPACKDDNLKPIAKADQYPSALYGAWEWPCVEDYDTQDTAAPLYRQQKRFYGPNNTYLFERTTYAFRSVVTKKCSVPLAKATHKGTYNATVKNNPTVSLDPYVEVDEIIEIVYEGNKPLAATTASRNRHVVGFKFFDNS